ncbi:MAG: FAD-dependent oxidoreductase [Pseudonocardiaceae bacterium]
MSSDEHYDVIVVGSGFGGSVAAYRLAQSGLRVCVLERGKAYPPGSFARRPREMAANYWDPSQGRHGLFNFWSFRGIEAVVSSGLGGGSLIYANVMIRKDERWFVQDGPSGAGYEPWPITRADLDPHYEQVERMLTVTPYPLEAPDHRDMPKTRAMQEAGQRLGLQWGLPNLAVSFAASPQAPPKVGVPIAEGDYPNLHEQTRLTCRLCGECDIGCNYGSKNTLDHTYLSAAKHHGADIRVRSEVRRFQPREGGGFSVHYVEHHPHQEGRPTETSKLPHRVLTAARVVLAAGALGTPYLLLRNRSAFPRLSPALGTRFCGNGDLLTLLLRGRQPGGGPRVLDGSRGPVITSFLRVPDRADPDGDGPGYYIQDAGYPGFIDWLAENTQVRSTAHRLLRFAARRIWARIAKSPKSDLSAELALLHGTSELSSGSLPLLGMGRDVPDGVMKLRRGYLDIDWTVATSKPYFARVKSTMAAMADELGARFRENPLSHLKRVITVHPLGGCPMGKDDRHGVVDSYGQAFNYPGLYIADGSVMPGPVGPNPSLTIAAFADRMAEKIIDSTTTTSEQHPAMTTNQGTP